MPCATKIIGLLIIMAFSATVCSAIPNERLATSSTGEWILCEDPDNGPSDKLDLRAEGYGFLVRTDRPRVPFLFTESETQVLLVFLSSAGRTLAIKFDFADEKRRLNLYSERTKHWSYYVKAESAASYSCTAK